MANRQVVQVGPLAASNAALFAGSQTPTSGTALTLTGAAPDVPRRVLLTFGNELSARTLVITGLNASGNPIQETLAVASGAPATVATVQDFKTVTRALPAGGGWSAAVTLGTNGAAGSPWQLVDYQISPGNISFGVTVSGTVTYSVEYTYTDLNDNGTTIGGANGNFPSTPIIWTHPILNGLSAKNDGVVNDPIIGWRLTVTVGTGSATAVGLQAGISNQTLF